MPGHVVSHCVTRRRCSTQGVAPARRAVVDDRLRFAGRFDERMPGRSAQPRAADAAPGRSAEGRGCRVVAVEHDLDELPRRRLVGHEQGTGRDVGARRASEVVEEPGREQVVRDHDSTPPAPASDRADATASGRRGSAADRKPTETSRADAAASRAAMSRQSSTARRSLDPATASTTRSSSRKPGLVQASQQHGREPVVGSEGAGEHDRPIGLGLDGLGAGRRARGTRPRAAAARPRRRRRVRATARVAGTSGCSTSTCPSRTGGVASGCRCAIAAATASCRPRTERRPGVGRRAVGDAHERRRMLRHLPMLAPARPASASVAP